MPPQELLSAPEDQDSPAKTAAPPLPTLEELKAAVPPHCFQVHTLTSAWYLLRDYLQLAFLYVVVLPLVEEHFGWPGLLLWIWVTGVCSFALFALGHDCSHSLFSKNFVLNEIAGHLCHSPLMIPYWSLQKSHRLHHQHTNHVFKDKGHPWITEERRNEQNFMQKHGNKAIPFVDFILWIPVYLLLGVPDGSHFWPWSKLFKTTEDRIKCVVSTAVSLCFLATAYHLCDYNLVSLTKYYLLPLMVNGFWVSMVTYLHHREDTIELYEDGTWTFIRGQLQTVDRRYGFGLEWLLHNLTDGHLAHHLFFRQLPHYHCLEAMEAMKPVLAKYGDIYRYRNTPQSIFEYFRMVLTRDYFVGLGTGVLHYAGIDIKSKYV